MTDQPTDRLALIESLLLQTAQSQRMTQQQLDRTQQQLDQLTIKVDANATAIASLTRDYQASIEDLVESGIQTNQLVAENSNAIRAMQTEVRGLQVENRRILQELRDWRRGTE